MKTNKIVWIVLAIMFSSAIKAQNDSLTTITHPSIEGFKVVYKPTLQSGAPDSLFRIPVIPLVTLSLKNGASCSRIHFKILDVATNNVLYSVSYNLSDTTVTNGASIKLFENDNGVISLSPAQTYLLKPHIYTLQTEDASGILSPLFSTKQ